MAPELKKGQFALECVITVNLCQIYALVDVSEVKHGRELPSAVGTAGFGRL